MNPDQFREAIEQQERLVKQVRSLRRGYWVNFVMVVALIIGTSFMGYLLWHVEDLQDHLEEVVHDQEVARVERALEICRTSNGSNAQMRNLFLLAFNALGHYNPDSAGLQALVVALKEAIPTPAEQDRDCNGDGHLSLSKDYPPG